MSSRSLFPSFVLLTSSFALGACGGAEKPPETASGDVTCPPGQKFDGSYCVVDASAPPSGDELGGATGGASTGAARTTSTGGGASTSSGGAATSASPAGGTATGGASSGAATGGAPSTTPASNLAAPVDVSMAAAAAPLIQYLAASHLPAGARTLGAPFAGQFTEGQVLEQKVTLAPGKCYTVVAAATPPVVELGLAFYPVSPTGSAPPAVPLLADTDVGTQAVIGRKNDCFKSQPGQTEVLLVLRVEKGRGVAAAQVFEK